MPEGSFSKILISFIIFINIVFTAVVLFIFYKVQAVPDSLVIAWFSFTTGEVGLTAFIRISKIKKFKIKKEVENESI